MLGREQQTGGKAHHHAERAEHVPPTVVLGLDVALGDVVLTCVGRARERREDDKAEDRGEDGSEGEAAGCERRQAMFELGAQSRERIAQDRERREEVVLRLGRVLEKSARSMRRQRTARRDVPSRENDAQRAIRRHRATYACA